MNQTTQNNRFSFSLVIAIIFSPREAFGRLSGRPVILFSIGLMVLRYSVATFSTVVNLYYHSVPMVLPPPVAIEPQRYRYYEIFWYGPYGIVMMIVITLVLLKLSRQIARGNKQLSISDMLGITSLAFFTPWLVTSPVDFLMIAGGYGAPQFLIPLHLSILAWESWLVTVGVQTRFGLSKMQSYSLGLAAAGLFIAMGGPLIR